MTDSKASRLEMKQISIAFPGVQALTDVDFQALPAVLMRSLERTARVNRHL